MSVRRTFRRVPLTACAALMVLIAASAGCRKQESRTPSSDTPMENQKSAAIAVPQFDGARTFDLLRQQVAFGPRVPGSKAHDSCLRFLYDQLLRQTDHLTRQDFTVKGYDNATLKLTNIFAAFQPSKTERILLLAHWDSRPRADMESDPARQKLPIPGANDGASGTATLLELGRLLHDTPPPVGVDILLVDGEDYGKEGDLDRYSLGTRHFVRIRPLSYHPKFGVLVDMIGDADLRIPMEQNSMTFAPEAMQLIWDTAQRIGVTQFVAVPGEQIFDDHIPLNQAGIPTVDIIDFQYPYWHTLQDTPDKCSPGSLEAVGNVLAHVIYEMHGGLASQ